MRTRRVKTAAQPGLFDEPASASTAPWDQPRNASTVTIEHMDALALTDDDILAEVRRRWPQMVEPRVEYINSRKSTYSEREPGSVCLGLSWRNVR